MSNILQKCVIWGTSASVEPGPDSYIVDSPRAGGKYRITGSAIAMLESLSKEMKARLTWWLVERRREGETWPQITSHTFEVIRAVPIPSVIERRDRLLDFIAASSPTIAPRIQVAGTVTEKFRKQKENLAAYTSSQDDEEVRELIRFATEDGLVARQPESIHLTFKAWKHIEERRTRQTASAQGFVAMWFNATLEHAYEQGFARAITESGYIPLRIDRKEHINKIDDEIISEIRRSRFLVADFTSETDRPRGGVYFEAGFAFGLNIPVIWACREDMVGQLHFDIRQFNHIVWTTPDDLRQKLKNRIGAVLGDGPTKHTA